MRARLLSSDEWTAIARCGKNRDFPWGDGWPPTRGNYHGQEAASSVWDKISGFRDAFPVTAPVEQSGKNEWGLYGVGGNIWEWTSEQSGSSRSVRGGSWISSSQVHLQLEYRINVNQSTRFFSYGFRVLLAP